MTLTKYASLALAASLALGTVAAAPAHDDDTTTSVHRIDHPCDAEPRPAWQLHDPDVDICTVELTSTVDDETGVITDLTLALEVAGELQPQLGRGYTIVLEAYVGQSDVITGGSAEEHCTVEFSLVDRGDGPVLRDGLSSCGRAYRGDELGAGSYLAEFAQNFVDGGAITTYATATFEGSRMDVTLDLSSPSHPLYDLLRHDAGISLRAIAGSERGALQPVSLAMPVDQTYELEIDSLGIAPAVLKP